MSKREVNLGPKHHTATYYVNGRPLDFIDLALHLALTANDNSHRLNYPLQDCLKWLEEIVNLGYAIHPIKTKKDFQILHNNLIDLYRKYYPNLMKNKTFDDIDCNLPIKIIEGGF